MDISLLVTIGGMLVSVVSAAAIAKTVSKFMIIFMSIFSITLAIDLPFHYSEQYP